MSGIRLSKLIGFQFSAKYCDVADWTSSGRLFQREWEVTNSNESWRADGDSNESWRADDKKSEVDDRWPKSTSWWQMSDVAQQIRQIPRCSAADISADSLNLIRWVLIVSENWQKHQLPKLWLCLKAKSKDYQNGLVLCRVWQLCTMIGTQMWAVLNSEWLGLDSICLCLYILSVSSI